MAQDDRAFVAPNPASSLQEQICRELALQLASNINELPEDVVHRAKAYFAFLRAES